jgi:hypothetical protein
MRHQVARAVRKWQVASMNVSIHHGMQEVRGSNPLSSTFPQFKGMLRAWKMISERLQPSKLSEAQVFVRADVDAGQVGACTPGGSCFAAFSVRQPK